MNRLPSSGLLPNYLKHKLSLIGIDSLVKLKQVGYLKLFSWLRHLYPSVGYKVLYDLYSVCHNISLNSLTKQQQVELVNCFKRMPPSYPPLSALAVDNYMGCALNYANQAYINNEVPIGAVIVKDDKVIGYGHNQTLTRCDIMAHAEVLAITMAQSSLANYRLQDCDLYVTIEPCLMCCGAIINARIKRVIFGATEPLTGACISQYQVFSNHQVNNFTEIIGPLDNKFYGELLKSFFTRRRA
jgi:tRNA(Arg) A34 adenosine deaminase TadA